MGDLDAAALADGAARDLEARGRLRHTGAPLQRLRPDRDLRSRQGSARPGAFRRRSDAAGRHVLSLSRALHRRQRHDLPHARRGRRTPQGRSGSALRADSRRERRDDGRRRRGDEERRAARDQRSDRPRRCRIRNRRTCTRIFTKEPGSRGSERVNDAVLDDGHEQRRGRARDALRRDEERRPHRDSRRRRRRARQRLSHHQGLHSRVRPRARDRHADCRSVHRRHRDRNGDGRPAADRRDSVRRLHLPRVQSDRRRRRAIAATASTRARW